MATPANYFFYDFVKVTGILPSLVWFAPKKLYPYGKPGKIKGGTLIVANHSSFTDPIPLMCAFASRRIHFIATKDLYKSKLGSFFFDHVHCIKIDKDNFAIDSFNKIVSLLKKGKVVAVFPEGTVHNNDTEVKGFKSGAALMAIKGKSAILPVYMEPKKHFMGRTYVAVGKKMDFKDVDFPSAEIINEISESLYHTELELQDFTRRRLKNE